MSQLAKTAREAMHAKAHRLVQPHTGKVDASNYDAPPTFSAEEPTGKAPVTRQHKFKRGGKVEGEAAGHRADRSPRHGNKRPGKDLGGALAAVSPLYALLQKDKNAGDSVPTGLLPSQGGSSRLSKSIGLKDGGSVSYGALQGTRPTGGRLARNSGGRAKGKTDINIIISAGGKGQDPNAPPPAPMMPPPHPPMPVAAPPMPPPAALAAMAGPMGPGGPGGPPPMPMPMARKRGGRTMTAGAGSGVGRLEKL